MTACYLRVHQGRFRSKFGCFCGVLGGFPERVNWQVSEIDRTAIFWFNIEYIHSAVCCTRTVCACLYRVLLYCTSAKQCSLWMLWSKQAAMSTNQTRAFVGVLCCIWRLLCDCTPESESNFTPSTVTQSSGRPTLNDHSCWKLVTFLFLVLLNNKNEVWWVCGEQLHNNKHSQLN